MSSSTLPLHFRRFVVALALTLTVVGLIVGWVYIAVILPHGWDMAFAIGSVLVAFAWFMSADTGDDPL